MAARAVREHASASPSRSEVEAGLPQGAEASEGAAESGGGAVSGSDHNPPAAPVAEPAPAPVPGSASALAAGGATAYTPAEDDIIVAEVVAALRAGETKTEGHRRAAARLGRSEGSCKLRAFHKLAERIDAALAWAQTQVKVETQFPEVGVTAPSKGDAAVGGQTPAAVQTEPESPDLDAKSRSVAIAHGNGPSFIADPVTAHLMALPTKGGWTLPRDLELMELTIAGWQPNEIGLELVISAKDIKARFDLLTGLHEDEVTGKQVRRWSREAVLAALQSLVARDPKAGAA